MALLESDIEKVEELVRKGDSVAWELGDLLKRMAPADFELQKLSERVGLTKAVLRTFIRTATETPEDNRHPEKYSHSIYRIFARINDPGIRWQLLFSRPNWTVEEASKTVREIINGASKRSDTVTKSMVVGDIQIRGKLDIHGVLTVRVWRGKESDPEITDSNDNVTTVTFSN